MNSPTKWPIRKISAVGISSLVTAIIIVLVWILNMFFPTLNVSNDIIGAIAILLMAIIPPLTGYAVKNNPGDFNHRATLKKTEKK